MPTKKIISDMVLYRLAGGVPDASFPVDELDIWAALEHKVNSMFKMNQFSVNLPSGETIPDNLAIATYEDVPVVKHTVNESKAVLPVMPISLPRNAGIQEVRPVFATNNGGERIVGQPMIPVQAGQRYLIQADLLLNELMGQLSYEPNGKSIIISKNLLTLQITKVDIKLVVMDMSQYGVTDELPIPADFLDKIINDLVTDFAPVVSESGQVNPWTSAGQTVPDNASNGKR